MNEQLKRYFEIVNKINSGSDLNNGDLQFFMSYSPEIDETKINDFLKNKSDATPEQFKTALIEATRKIQSEPAFKEKLLKIATEQQGRNVSEKFAQGINLFLAGTDVANSIGQIAASKSALSKSTRPGRPGIPQKDLRLQQALRNAQEGTYDTERAIAPVRAQIQDQYQNDIANAKTASAGQAGQFGAYAQLAANRRNRAALNLAPIQDQIRQGQQQNYNNLLGQQMGETQQMFQNQADLYNTDLQQYGLDQQAAAQLGSTGRSNFRDSLYNLGSNVAQGAGDFYSQRRYRNLKNQASAAYNPALADKIVKVHQDLDGYTGGANDTPEFWNEMYTGY